MPATQAPAPQVVQRLLAEVRELKVARERLHLEILELRRRGRSPDPRIASLEREIQRLRAELESARAARDALEAGVREALGRLRDA